MRARQISLATLAAAALIAGCGDDDGGSSTTAAVQTTQPPPATTTGPVASTPDATPPPPPTVTDIPTSTVPSPPTTTPTPQEEQGGGGEQAIRVPAVFALRGGRLTPPRITVPARLAIELSVSSDAAHAVELMTPEPQTLEVAAGATESLRMPGLRAGSYTITVDGQEAGELIVGGEAGP
ncbi:hypothetical protein VSS74_31385 [Conexibacter stalactiti]|uniref:Uncharacterized protein n=1 Tax=Conexibacter stalactiti TaxID=1940611 RepID=A0ABU4I157_9ACTN|nr:hypothetical protein [Conexibacter stalactiti]MDW5598904.1 hypothetical protein [Conexibacter stalactiti]MEC5039546.1 hypothetical protein [Conexibacter stalactiti]